MTIAGKLFAESLASDGANVVHYNSPRRADEAQGVVNDLKATGVEAIAHQGDLTSNSEIARLIDTTIDRFGIGPGAFTTGTNHYAHAWHPDGTAVEHDYDALYPGIMDEIPARQAELAPPGADPSEVARQIARVVGLAKGQRPFRVHVDPMHDGAEDVFDLGDRIRTEFYVSRSVTGMPTQRAASARAPSSSCRSCSAS